MVIVLDSFPAGSVTKLPNRRKMTISDHCYQWINACEAAGHRIMVPAVVYYENLRELEQRRAFQQIVTLQNFCLEPSRYIPLDTAQLEFAAKLWGQARRAGQPTADRLALDVDVILAAQALSLNIPAPHLIVATTNPAHLLRYVPADLWTNIQP